MMLKTSSTFSLSVYLYENMLAEQNGTDFLSALWYEMKSITIGF